MEAWLDYGDKRITLSNGTNIIGRLHLGVKDPKVSRKQLCIEFDAATGFVNVRKPPGPRTNPSFVADAVAPDDKQEVVPGNNYAVCHGDRVYFTAAHVCTLTIQSTSATAAPLPSTLPPTPTAAAPSPSAAGPAPTHAPSPAVAPSQLLVGTQSLHPSGTGGTGASASPALGGGRAGRKREKCRYGAACYRKNPDHLRRFSHSPDPPASGAGAGAGAGASAGAGAGGAGAGAGAGAAVGTADPPKVKRRAHAMLGSGGIAAAGGGDAAADAGSGGIKAKRARGTGVSFTPSNPLSLSLPVQTPPRASVLSSADDMPASNSRPADSSDAGGDGHGASGAVAPGTHVAAIARNASAVSAASTVDATVTGHVLVTPVLSVGKELQFPADVAVPVLIQQLQAFCKAEATAVFSVFVVCDPTDGVADTVQAAVATEKAKSAWDDRVTVVVGNIAEPRVTCKLSSSAEQPITLVNRCNWRLLKRGRDPVNAAVHKAVPDLEERARELRKTLEVGETCTVKLKRDYPLRKFDGVKWVMNVLSPSMNPARDDCLVSKPTEAAALLAEAYQAMFASFKAHSKSFATFRGPTPVLAASTTSAPVAKAATPPPPPPPPPPSLPAATTSRGVEETKINPDDAPPSLPVTAPSAARPSRPSTAPSWAKGLTDYVTGRNKTGVVVDESDCVIVKDCYPKAKHHYLLIAKSTRFRSAAVSDLTFDDLPAVRKLHARAHTFAQSLVDAGSTSAAHPFKIGHHAVPSMKPLHIHIISQDFVSSSLKTKKHYLSFTTSFFLKTETVESDLEWNKGMDISKPVYDAMLKGPLACHRCAQVQRNMPTLKAHIETCTASVH